MTINEMKDWKEGRDYWNEYVQLNGYAWEPTRKGLQKLSKLLDLNVAYLQKRINFYLTN